MGLSGVQKGALEFLTNWQVKYWYFYPFPYLSVDDVIKPHGVRLSRGFLGLPFEIPEEGREPVTVDRVGFSDPVKIESGWIGYTQDDGVVPASPAKAVQVQGLHVGILLGLGQPWVEQNGFYLPLASTKKSIIIKKEEKN